MVQSELTVQMPRKWLGCQVKKLLTDFPTTHACTFSGEVKFIISSDNFKGIKNFLLSNFTTILSIMLEIMLEKISHITALSN